MLNGLDKIEGLTPEQMEAINGLAGGLISKKTELEEKLSKAKGSLSAESSAQEKLNMLEANIERERLESKENYQGALSLKEQEYSAQLEKLTSVLKERDSFMVGNIITDEFVKLGVNKDLMEDLAYRFSSRAVVVDGKAMVDDKSLSECMKEWSDTPAGKASRVAPNNMGGGGLGGAGKPEVKKMSDMNGAERTALFRADPAEFNRLKAEMPS